MPTVTVTVYRDGKRVKGARVGLGAGPIGGVYGPEYTGYDGVAEFDVEYGQGGDVFVNGSPEGPWGVPGTTDVTVDL